MFHLHSNLRSDFYFQLDIMHFQKEVNGKLVWKGVCIEIIDAIAQALNFRLWFKKYLSKFDFHSVVQFLNFTLVSSLKSDY